MQTRPLTRSETPPQAQDIVLTLRPAGAGVDPVHALRRGLKYLLRACQLRCINIERVPR
jgi:hypothetical protein